MSRELRIHKNRIDTSAEPQTNAEPWYQRAFEDDEPRPSLRTPLVAGSIAIILGFGGFLGWGFTANLDSAAIATGNVIVDSQRKTITHLEGGILKRLLVQEGEFVEKGQSLVELDETRARADLEQLRGKRIGLMAMISRLKAERDMASEIEFPSELQESDSEIVADVVAAERRLFEKRREFYEGKIAYQQKEIEQYTAQIEAAEAQISANLERRRLLKERVDALSGLEKKGYASKANLSVVELELNELIGDGGELVAEKARSEKARQGAEVTVLSIEQELQSEIAGSLLEAQLELNATNEQLKSARDVLERLVVHAPQGGIVYNVQMRTPGGVVEPGKPIMDIVPKDEKLLVEARMNLRDIDSVHVGQKTRVRLTAYDIRKTPPLDGEVTFVAADQTVDEKSQVAYYVVRAEIDPAELKDNPLVALYPGMPAELQIMRRSRKAIEYLVEPITESFSRAFRED